jgi:hypothetical protein
MAGTLDRCARRAVSLHVGQVRMAAAEKQPTLDLGDL